jgi:SET and MYND domain-containing protein
MSAAADGDDSNPWSCLTPTRIEGKGEALLASRDLPPNRVILRVAPFAAVPYGRFLHALCSGCLQPCDASRRCVKCGVASHCALCASSFAGRAHRFECHALRRLAANEAGLTLHHDDLRLLLRVLSRRKDEAEKKINASEREGPLDETTDSNARRSDVDPSIEAASNVGDLIVDGLDSLNDLASGMDDEEEVGVFPEAALVAVAEVSKQCKFLVDPECRGSLDLYANILGKLQVNGFEITEAASPGDDAVVGNTRHADAERRMGTAKTRSRRPSGLGVYPSAAGFNHSCDPNCAQRFDAFGCVVIETEKAIRKGDELTIPYVDVRLSVDARNDRLVKNFAFTCACDRCARERLHTNLKS